MSFKSFLCLAWKCPKPIGKSLIHCYSHVASPWWKSCRRAVFTAAVSTKQRFHSVFPSLRCLHPAFCVPPRSRGRACSHDALTQRQWFSLRLHTFKKKEKKQTEPTCISGWRERTHPVRSVAFYFFSLDMFHWRIRPSEPCHLGSRVKFIRSANVAFVSFEAQTSHFSNNLIVSLTCQPHRSCPTSMCWPFWHHCLTFLGLSGVSSQDLVPTFQGGFPARLSWRARGF